jgi:hypothetical protein
MSSQRGRAKKTKVSDTEVTPVVAAVPATKVKKSKKPLSIVAVVTPTGIEGNFSSEPRRPLIAHLQIKSSEVKFHDTPMQYDPNPPTQPEPYDATADNFFTAAQETLDLSAEEEKKEVVTTLEFEAGASAVVEKEARPLQLFTRASLMVQYADSAKTKKIPDSTEISCFWCTHSFDGQPCIIPEREEKGVYRVYGNFCCPSCAMSYLLQESLDPHVRWERIALLNRIYDTEGLGRIFPAPARETLDIFGGPISIESFRSTIASGKVRVDVHMPPMVSILGSIDTKPIDFFDSTLKNTLIHPTPLDKGPRTEEGLRLKRNKPLKDKESTLDSVMNIQFRGGPKIDSNLAAR